MAFEADCASSTVLEALSVASTVGFIVPGECRSTICSESGCQASPVNAGRSPRRFRKFEIRNPKSEIRDRAVLLHCAAMNGHSFLRKYFEGG